MFIGAVYVSESDGVLYRRIEFHLKKLFETGRVGRFSESDFGKLRVYSDAESPHFYHGVQNDVDLFFGGYMSKEHLWSGDCHTAEQHGTWGEWIAFKIRSNVKSKHLIDLKVFNGPSGSWPIFYGTTNGITAISNDPMFVAIAIGSYSLNLKGSIELLTYDHTLGIETTIQNVNKLLFGQELFFNIDTTPNLSVRSRENQYRYLKTRTNAATVFESLSESVGGSYCIAKKLPSSTLQISGGLDSRLTLGILAMNFHERPISKTLNISNVNEVNIAREVASTLGFPHEIIDLKETDHGVDYLHQGWILTGGQVSPYAAAGNLVYFDAIIDLNGEKIVFGGWPGDCLIGSYVVNSPMMLSKLFEKSAISRWVAKRSHSLRDMGITYSHKFEIKLVLRNIDEQLVKRIRENSGSNAAQKISFWAMFDRQPSFSYLSPSNLTSRVLQITPLISDEYIRELLKLSAVDLIDKNFYRRLFHEYFKEVASIPYALTNKSISREYSKIHVFPRNYSELLLLLPVKTIKVLRPIAQRVRISLQKKGVLSPKEVIELDFWRLKAKEHEGSKNLEINGIDLFNDGNDLHALNVFQALNKTKEHLREARDIP